MEKIYGFKEKDVKELISYLEEREGESLSKVFAAFGERYGKSKGTVRNMYYALAKKSREDEDFAEKYLGGKPLAVQKIAEFDKDEERKLVKNIIDGKRKGKSVRAVINELAGGDQKLALRYQNKYRNVIKSKQSLTAEIVTEIHRENGGVYDPVGLRETRVPVSELQFKRLQKEINGLVDKLTGKLKKENMYLKSRLNEVEIENIRLKNVLYGGEGGKKAAAFFKNDIDKNILN